MFTLLSSLAKNNPVKALNQLYQKVSYFVFDDARNKYDGNNQYSSNGQIGIVKSLMKHYQKLYNYDASHNNSGMASQDKLVVKTLQQYHDNHKHATWVHLINNWNNDHFAITPITTSLVQSLIMFCQYYYETGEEPLVC